MDMLSCKINKKKRKPVYRKYKQHKVTLGNRVLMVQGYEPQALKYLQEQGFKPEDIQCEVEGTVPEIQYTYSKKERKYIPDMYIPKDKLIIEVKSMSTLGLLNNKRRGWSMTCAKAIACHKKGFKFALLLMSSSGKRIKLPKNWAKMKKEEVIDWVEKFGGLERKKFLI